MFNWFKSASPIVIIHPGVPSKPQYKSPPRNILNLIHIASLNGWRLFEYTEFNCWYTLGFISWLDGVRVPIFATADKHSEAAEFFPLPPSQEGEILEYLTVPASRYTIITPPHITDRKCSKCGRIMSNIKYHQARSVPVSIAYDLLRDQLYFNCGYPEHLTITCRCGYELDTPPADSE